MKIVKLLQYSALLALVQGCVSTTTDVNGYVFIGNILEADAPDIEAITLSGFTGSPNTYVLIQGRVCDQQQTELVLDNTFSSGSADPSSGGYPFSFTVDATLINGIDELNGGCVELRMFRWESGTGWLTLATFDTTGPGCLSGLAGNPMVTEEQAIEQCRRDSDWLRYAFWVLG